MRKTILFFTLIFPFILLSQSTNTEAENLIDYMVNELVKLPSMPPGISVAISSNNKIIYSKGFGYTNLRTKTKVTPNTQFRAGSLSRLVTITALAKLVENEKVSFNDNLQDILPNYPRKKYSFTIKQLASGLSGMKNYIDQDTFVQTSYNSVDEALDVFSHVPLAYRPGDKYNYSTHGYTLLSKVIEEASDLDFRDVLKQEVLSPLSMNSTRIEDIANRTNHMTELFQLNNEGYMTQLDTLKNYSYSWAGAGIISTPNDLLKLGNSYTNGFIKIKELNTIFEIQKLNSGDTIRQNIGWDKNWDMDDRKVFEQDGSAEGARNIVSVFPDEKLSIALMANAFRLRAIEETVHTLAIPFLTKPSPQSQPKGIFELELDEDVRGEWLRRNAYIVLNGEHDRLVIDPGTGSQEIYKLIYLNRKNKYALLHTDGILYSEIDWDKDSISGKVMYYRGPNLHKTSTEPPYLKFQSLKKSG
ncbi:serine hydrolase domain-containing protein [Flagellimonas lutimaris]|uniref:serine hydrolase domain-containing protein n=1 Tax=Flagellimonas lutimaris TaxID=475082 RepID=UPI003F5CF1F5